MRKHQLILLLISVALTLAPARAQTTLYLRSVASPLGTLATTGGGIGCVNGTNDYVWRAANSSSGTEISNIFAPTSTAPPCLVQTASGSGQYLRWISPPVSSAVNLTGNYDYQAKCQESVTQLNAGFDFLVSRWSVTKGGVDLMLDDSANSTECGTTAGNLTIAAHAPSCGASCNLAVGDRLVIQVRAQNIGSWGGNGTRTFSLYYEGANSFAHFAQTISFSSDANNARALVFP